MIAVCELGFSDGGHVPFNAGFLEIIRPAFPDEEVLFFGARTHIEELKKQTGLPLAESISWRDILPPERSVGYFGRLFCEVKIIENLLRTFPQGSRGHFIFTSVYSSTVMALKLVKLCQFQGMSVQVILHGGLNGIVGRRYRRPIYRFQDMKTALTLFGNRNIQYLALEECIRDVLLKNLPCLSGKIEALDHPLPSNEEGLNTHGLSTPIHFGFLGLANESKGFSLFVKLAKEMTAKYKDQVEFHAIGRLAGEGNPALEIDALATKPGVARLSRADFIQGLKKLHFIMFPHGAGHYELSPSGTMLDALAWEKPLIARRIPLFENMFKTHGDIGYLFHNDTELKVVVERIMQRVDKSHYDRQVLNLRKARSSRTPTALAASYREICRKM
jgi:hypothetical protein